MPNISRYVLVLTLLVFDSKAARILALYPTPSLSHQVVFRPLTLELLKRGHEVIVLTTDPIYKNGKETQNLTEIDVNELSYQEWRKTVFPAKITGIYKIYKNQVRNIYVSMMKLFQKQMSSKAMKGILSDTNKFDLIIVEAYLNTILGISNVLKAPVLQISSFGSVTDNLSTVGASSHPLIYPTMTHRRIYNLTFLEKLSELYYHVQNENLLRDLAPFSEGITKKVFGEDTPSLYDLQKNVHMLCLNVHPIWEGNRPVPTNVLYMGGIHQEPERPLPQNLKEYLDRSQNGVIYVSFGTNVKSELLDPNAIQILVNVLSKLPYDILWKWNHDELPGRTKNIKLSKWLPQVDLLKHPNVKLFITQGGLQSTDEAITAGVPMIGIPFIADQWYNVEKYAHLKIGVPVSIENISEDILHGAIKEVLGNDRYRQNIQRFRTILQDQPQPPLQSTIWWIEYILRHEGAKHLRSPCANMPWTEYFEVELIFYSLSSVIIFIVVFLVICYQMYTFLL